MVLEDNVKYRVERILEDIEHFVGCRRDALGCAMHTVWHVLSRGMPRSACCVVRSGAVAAYFLFPDHQARWGQWS